MFKNTAGQKLTVFAFDSTTNLPKTGDAANLTAYRDLDDGGVTVLGDTTATEKDATNAKGYYIFDLTQGETNGDKILFSAKSSTANIVVIAVPAVVYTVSNNFNDLVIDSSGNLTAGITGNITGNLSGSVGSVTGNVSGSVASVTGAVGSVTGSVGSVTGAVGSVTGNVGGSVGSVATGGITSGSFAAGAINAAAIAADAIGASELAADAVAEIADQVWDEVLSGHLTAGSTGNALNAAGSAGDPWSTAIPGAYGAGSAGYIVGNNLDAAISSRMATFTLPTNFSSLAISAGGVVNADAVAISTDTVAADRLETMLDGTGGQTLSLGSIAVTGGVTFANSSGTGFTCSSSGGNGNGALFTGNGSGEGIQATGGATGHGMGLQGGATTGHGLYSIAATSGDGIHAAAAGTGNYGIDGYGGSGNSGGVRFQAGATGTEGVTVTGTASISSTLAVSGTTTLAALTTTGTVTMNALTVSNATTLSGAVTATNASNQISLGTDMITAGTIAADAIGSSELAGTAVTEIQTGLSTLDAAGVRTAVGLASANLDTQLSAIAADLPTRITKNTALSAFEFFMVDSSDHVSGKTGLTITATRSLDGAAFGACANSASEVANGIYKIDLAAADLNANVVTLKFTATGADARLITIVTQPT